MCNQGTGILSRDHHHNIHLCLSVARWQKGRLCGRTVRSSEKHVVRPTARCLQHELLDGAGPVEAKKELSQIEERVAARPPSLLSIPLTEVTHPLMTKANLLALNESADREQIKSIRSHVLIKVKSSAHRGALWIDETGQWWLIAAGRRKNDDSDDFYTVLDGLRGDASALLPSEADQIYLRLETALIEECEEEREGQRHLLDALVRAAASPPDSFDADVHGATVTVRIIAGDDPATLELSFEFKDYDQYDRFPTDVLGYIPGYENIDNWDNLAPLKDGDYPIWYTLVSAAWLDWLTAAGRLDDLATLPASSTLPAPSDHSRFSHHTPLRSLKPGLVDGLEVMALCGARFTPHRDPEAFPVCPACEQLYSGLGEL